MSVPSLFLSVTHGSMNSGSVYAAVMSHLRHLAIYLGIHGRDNLPKVAICLAVQSNEDNVGSCLPPIARAKLYHSYTLRD